MAKSEAQVGLHLQVCPGNLPEGGRMEQGLCVQWGQSPLKEAEGSIPDPTPLLLGNQNGTLKSFGDLNGSEPGAKAALGKHLLNPQPDSIWDQLW